MFTIRKISVLATIFCLCLALSQCMNSAATNSPVNTAGFAGNASCQSCHSDIYAAHLKTAHTATSSLATRANIRGDFNEGNNSFSFDQHRLVRMEQRNGRFWQTEFIDGVRKRDKSIDLVIGSGVEGQTYASWTGDRLFQLPISYFTSANRWSNSPGFSDTVYYDRPIAARCMECHSTFVKVKQEFNEDTNAFDSTQMILGIGCEKCHGAGQAHVLYQQQHPNGHDSTLIKNPARFTRQQNLDLCGSCHGGQILPTTNAFKYVAGDTLSHYFIVTDAKPDPSAIDVHGNQLGLLKASKCFRMNETMTCSTCHDSHADQRGQLANFSARCMTCHKATQCPKFETIGPGIASNCIDCHMPKRASQTITMLMGKGQQPAAAMITSHFIAIYPDTLQHVSQH
jgi:Cytochrome c554 and c-prime